MPNLPLEDQPEPCRRTDVIHVPPVAVAILTDPEQPQGLKDRTVQTLAECGLVLVSDGSDGGPWRFEFDPDTLPPDSEIRECLGPDHWPDYWR